MLVCVVRGCVQCPTKREAPQAPPAGISCHCTQVAINVHFFPCDPTRILKHYRIFSVAMVATCVEMKVSSEMSS